MTATTATTDARASTTSGRSLDTNRGPNLLADSLTIIWRNLITIKRVPQLLVFSTIQPVIFVLLFRYVFGGAIPVPGIRYVDYLLPGIFGQTVAFGAISTGIGLAEDMSKGLIERFRSLPIARSSVLIGRTVADVLRNVFVQTLMALVGFAVGWRIHAGAMKFVLAMVLMLMFGFAMSWVFGLIGLVTANAETTQAAAFPLMAPIVFASSAFVPVANMPGWLQVWARNQPLSAVINATRKLTLGDERSAAIGLSESTLSLSLKAIGWMVLIVAIFAPLAIRRYRRTS